MGICPGKNRDMMGFITLYNQPTIGFLPLAGCHPTYGQQTGKSPTQMEEKTAGKFIELNVIH